MNFKFKDFKIFVVPETNTQLKRIKGNNQSGLIIVWESKEESEEIESFLAKILSAVQLDLSKDSSLIQLQPNEKMQLSQIKKTYPSKYLISFGLEPKRLGLHFDIVPYKALQHQEIIYLFADDLIDIYEERQAGGKQKSGALWKALQAIFLNKS